MSEQKKVDIVSICINNAWKGFKCWWIPLCLLSFVLAMTQTWLPQYLISNIPELEVFEPVKKELGVLIEQAEKNNGVAKTEDAEAFNTFLYDYFQRPEVSEMIKALLVRLSYLLLGVTLAVGIIHMALIVATKAACSKEEERTGICNDGVRKSPQLYLSYLALSLIKIIPFFFLILPGVYLYIKLYFTGYLITEGSANPFKAIAKSWKMSEGHFWDILILFIITSVIDSISVMTIIGIIPGTSMKYTLRASLYELIKNEKQPPALPNIKS